MTAKVYSDLLRAAKRIAYVEHEAEDLLQEALIVAMKESRLDFSSEADQKWITGVMRNKAKQETRSISRRRARDQEYTSENSSDVVHDSDEPLPGDMDLFLDSLSPAARKVAILVIHGLNRTEICSLLSLSNTAFRQRLTSIRKTLGPLPAAIQQEVIALAYATRQQKDKNASSLPVGLMRRALLKTLINDTNQSVGTHDPSGHLIVVATRNRKK